MTIKELAYSAQQHLQASTGSSLKRAHIYELLAASFGFKSYAALGVDTVFTQRRSDDKRTGSHRDFVRRRCIELGYPPEGADLVSVSLGSFLAERQIGVVQISALISQLRGDWSSLDDDPADDDPEQFGDEQDDRLGARWADGDKAAIAPLMLDGLEAAASKGNALAHYALALIHAPDDDDDTDRGGGKLLLALPGTTGSCADRRGKGVGRGPCGSTHSSGEVRQPSSRGWSTRQSTCAPRLGGTLR